VWDFFAISTYLIGSTTFLILPIIPDLALLRDKCVGWRRKLYSILCLGWRGTQKQWHQLEAAMRIMTIVIIPVAVSVHTIVSWDFAMTPVPMWHSTIFAPYFVVGAIFSGIAALIIAMVFLRSFLHLEEYLTPECFDNLGKLLLVMSLLWFYFIFAERLTTWYGNTRSEMDVLWLTQRGSYRDLFWLMMVCNFVFPFPLLAIKKLRTIWGTFLASVTIVIGMWIERYLIIVPSLSHKFLPYAWGSYRPTWVEITITIATFCGMALLYILFSKIVPIVSVWELKAGLRQ
jgi:molybdopterin-containing oxidoreductase family membrane subunit